ncbi:PhaM family polyhydroxyalkanoate granule multifunctional regulatory protein [Pelistega suis]|uniref:PhaM family polyhydroxyalkanoate granule multifunctional regulatory protein n=1 Tax=Pelistega suis TaxID=1631957 RepID=UPI00211BFD62|nr:PhaM family polyhydroxyalkanoate granule multifunctional regulatory protein [Pelistega suis]MCQ9329347.1 hypothetical protein [Pelistega suis]
MSDSKNMFDQIFNAEHFKNPFFGNAEAFQKAWQDTLQKNQIGFSQSSEQSIEELDKRINELKSVENWLSLNLSMLKNTIQSLELQRTNLQSLQEMMQNNDALQAAGQQWWNSLQEQFQGFLKTQSDILEQSQQKADTLKSAQKDAPTSASKIVKNKPATKVARKTSLKKG